MEYDYGAMMYYISAGDFTGLDTFFSQFRQKMRLYEDQTLRTIALYHQDKAGQHAQLKEVFDADNKAASKRYDEVYTATAGPEHQRMGLAIHDSGIDMLTDRYAMDCELLDQRHDDMSDIFYNSTIITLYTLLEAELKQLCSGWKTLTGHKIALTDFGQRDYTGAAFKYLELVMDLAPAALEPFKNKLGDLQNLRNRLIHDNGRFSKDGAKLVKNLVDSSKGGLVALADGDDIQLKITRSDYIMDWFAVIREFFEELFWQIDGRLDHRFLKARLQFLFGVLNSSISIDKLTVQRKGRKKTLQIVVDSADFDHLYRLQALIEIKDAEINKVKLVNNVKTNLQAERLIRVLRQNDHILVDRTFNGLLQNRGGNFVTLVIQKELP